MRVRTTATRKRDGENELQDSPGERELPCRTYEQKPGLLTVSPTS